MSEKTIHRCPTCGDSYLGNVCESCFKSAPEDEQTAFIKEYLKDFDHHYQDNVADSKKNYAPTPGTTKPVDFNKQPVDFNNPIISASLPDPRGGSVYMDDDYDYMMHNEEIDVSEIPESKPTLKVFQIKVWKLVQAWAVEPQQ